MRVAVIGAGGMGAGFARALAGKYEVFVGSRDPEKAVAFAQEIGAAGGGSYTEAAKDAEVVFLVPWVAVDETLPQLEDLTGKVLIDVTTGTSMADWSSLKGLRTPRRSKMAPSARVVKGWNTIFSSVVQSGPRFDGQSASVFLAGDDTAAKGDRGSIGP